VTLLLDANLSPSITAGLAEAGFDAVHVGEVDLLTASDAAIVGYARANDLVVVTVDSDFAAMLAIEGAERPSVVQLRDVAELDPAAHLGLLVANLGAVAEDIAVGAIVSLSPTRLAVRRLPIRRVQ
jgi:predicted nuclease of predicted toxin-antitoxin system